MSTAPTTLEGSTTGDFLLAAGLETATANLGYVPSNHLILTVTFHRPNKPGTVVFGPSAALDLGNVTEHTAAHAFDTIHSTLRQAVTSRGLTVHKISAVIIAQPGDTTAGLVNQIREAAGTELTPELGFANAFASGEEMLVFTGDDITETRTLGNPYTSVPATVAAAEQGAIVHGTREQARTADPTNARGVTTMRG